MSGGKSTDTAKQITYLAAALKAPRITEAAARMADHKRLRVQAGQSEDRIAALADTDMP